MSFGSGQSYFLDKFAEIKKSVYNNSTYMKNRFAGIFLTLILALAILSVSLIKAVTTEYAYSPMVLSEVITLENKADIPYNLPYPGKIMPDSIFWYPKVIRDKIVHMFTFGSDNHVKLALSFADKRLMMSKQLMEKGKPDLCNETLLKGEGYLRHSLEHEKIGDEYVEQIALSSLKHREMIEEEILPKAPEDLKPQIVKTLDYSKETYKKSREILNNRGLPIPHNPFDIE